MALPEPDSSVGHSFGLELENTWPKSLTISDTSILTEVLVVAYEALDVE